VFVWVTVLRAKNISTAALETSKANLLLTGEAAIFMFLWRPAWGCSSSRYCSWFCLGHLYTFRLHSSLRGWNTKQFFGWWRWFYLHRLGISCCCWSRGRFWCTGNSRKRATGYRKRLHFLWSRLLRCVPKALGTHIQARCVSEELVALHAQLRLHRFRHLLLVARVVRHGFRTFSLTNRFTNRRGNKRFFLAFTSFAENWT